jgi:hypothetical protein
VDLSINEGDTNIVGAKVYKAVEGMTLKPGYVVEKLVAGPYVVLTPMDATAPVGQGTVKIEFQNPTENINSGYFDDISLLNAKQEIKGLFSFVSLLPFSSTYKIPTAFLIKFRAPISLPTTDNESHAIKYKLYFYFTIFGNQASTQNKTAGLTVDYSICKDIQNSEDSLDTLISDVTTKEIRVEFSNTYEAYNPFILTNDGSYSLSKPTANIDIQKAIDINDTEKVPVIINNIEARDIVEIKISTRDPADDPRGEGEDATIVYDGNMGFLALSWKLESYDPLNP